MWRKVYLNRSLTKINSSKFSTEQAISLVFPGTGTHCQGMAKKFVGNSQAMKVLAECDNILKIPLTKLMLEGSFEDLSATEVCQPAIFINAYLLHEKAKLDKVFNDENHHIYIGHSLGEYTALAAAGVFNPVEVVRLLYDRAKLVKECCTGHHVGMLVVLDEYSGLEYMIETVKSLYPDKFCEVAAYNSKKQFILSGDLEVLDPIQKELAASNIKSAKVNAKAAFHSHLLTPMKTKFKSMLSKIQIDTPKRRVFRDIDAIEYKNKDEIIHGLVEQLDHPVKFKDIVEKCIKEKVNHFYDVGSHGYMTPLLKTISNEITVHKIY